MQDRGKTAGHKSAIVNKTTLKPDPRGNIFTEKLIGRVKTIRKIKIDRMSSCPQ